MARLMAVFTTSGADLRQEYVRAVWFNVVGPLEAVVTNYDGNDIERVGDRHHGRKRSGTPGVTNMTCIR